MPTSFCRRSFVSPFCWLVEIVPKGLHLFPKNAKTRWEIKGWFLKGGFGGCSPRTKTGTRVCSDVPPNENRNEGTLGCSPGTKTGTRARSPKPPFYETALLSPSEKLSGAPVLDIQSRYSWEFPNLVVSNLAVCNFHAEALFCTLLRPFALFCGLASHAPLRSFACFCVRPRLERLRLGISDIAIATVCRFMFFSCRRVSRFPPPNSGQDPGKKKNVYQYQSPSFFWKGHAMGKKMAGTNEFAFFRCRSMCTRGGSRIRPNKCKNAFWPVPVPKSTFPETNQIGGAMGGVKGGIAAEAVVRRQSRFWGQLQR